MTGFPDGKDGDNFFALLCLCFIIVGRLSSVVLLVLPSAEVVPLRTLSRVGPRIEPRTNQNRPRTGAVFRNNKLSGQEKSPTRWWCRPAWPAWLSLLCLSVLLLSILLSYLHHLAILSVSLYHKTLSGSATQTAFLLSFLWLFVFHSFLSSILGDLHILYLSFLWCCGLKKRPGNLFCLVFSCLPRASPKFCHLSFSAPASCFLAASLLFCVFSALFFCLSKLHRTLLFPVSRVNHDQGLTGHPTPPVTAAAFLFSLLFLLSSVIVVSVLLTKWHTPSFFFLPF